MSWLSGLFGALIFLVGYALGVWVGAGQARQRLSASKGDSAWKDELIEALTAAVEAWKGAAEGKERLIRALRSEGVAYDGKAKRYALNFCSNCGSRMDCEECAEEQ